MNAVRWMIVLLVLICAPRLATAQDAAERIEIGLSTDAIAITTDFSGEDITIFGAVDNIDPLVQRQGRYDLFVVLEGPRSAIVTRKKGRVLGIWMNVEDRSFGGVPQSYLVASTRLPRDIADLQTLEKLGLNTRALRLTAESEVEGAAEFADATREIKHNTGLYVMFPGNARFVSQSLFRAGLSLPANVPLGNHRVRAYLFKNGQLVAQTQAPLRIEKAGIEIQIFRFAQEQPLLYGIASVLMALMVGWLGRVIFKKD